MLNHQREKMTFSCIQTQIERNKTNEIIQFYGCFQMGLFAKYEALTIANSIRRTVLTQSRKYAITAVKIENIKHEYSSIKGVKETIFDILVNLQNIILYSQKKFLKTQVSYLDIIGPKKITASDLKLPAFLCCMNPSHHIATIECDSQFRMIIFIDHFSFYSSSLYTCQYYKKLYLQLSQLKSIESIGTTDFLLLNTKISPILNLNYTILQANQNKEMIIFDIWTDGSIHPALVLREAIQKLLILIIPFYQLKKLTSSKNNKNTKSIFSKLFISKLFKLDLCNFCIKSQIYLKLNDIGIYTIGDLYKLMIKKDNLIFTQLSTNERIEIKQLLKKINRYISPS